VDNDSEVLSVRSSSDRSSVDHDLRVVRRKARLIAAAEEALARARRQTDHHGRNHSIYSLVRHAGGNSN